MKIRQDIPEAVGRRLPLYIRTLSDLQVAGITTISSTSLGDTIGVTLTVKQITPRPAADYGEVRWDCVVTNQADEPVATYDVLTLVAKSS
mgnify:CR=1 FL=1